MDNNGDGIAHTYQQGLKVTLDLLGYLLLLIQIKLLLLELVGGIDHGLLQLLGGFFLGSLELVGGIFLGLQELIF